MKKADRVISVVAITFGVVVILLTRGFPSAAMPGTLGPAFFPRLIAFGLIACGVLMFVRTMRGNKDNQIELGFNSFPRVIGVTVLMGLLPLGLYFLGFLLICFLSCVAFSTILRVKLLSAVIIALCISFAIYVSFHYGLKVQFPKGVLW